MLLLVLVFSVALMRSAAGSNDCLAEQHLKVQMTTGQQEIQQHLTSVQIEVQQQMAALQQKVQQQLTALKKEGQQQMTAVQQQLTALKKEGQQQMTAVQQQLTAVQMEGQQQMTAVQQQLTAVQMEGQQQMTAVQAVLKQLGLVQTTCERCPTNWVKLDNNCYLLSTQEVTRLQADASCAALDHRARLASVRLANKDHVARLLADSGAVYTWIGLSRLSGDSWGWGDGTPLDFTNWQQGQPDNIGGDCVTMGGSSSKWYDKFCTVRRPYICQITL